MDIIISGSSSTPIYRQIADQVASHILSGTLVSGETLPPIRTVARDLDVSVITVKKAWEELERDGFIYGVVGKGSFVRDLGPSQRDDKRDSMAADQLTRELPYYRSLGLSKQDLVDLVERLY
ncbi:MAG: GntR family transcriptional regulator [Propionibacteriaceae bacterium]|nr:GntR family transcriptional regulator [Propionibacteriaceae bacterium]